MACQVRRNTIRQDADGSVVVTIGIESVRFNLAELNGICAVEPVDPEDEDEENP